MEDTIPEITWGKYNSDLDHLIELGLVEETEVGVEISAEGLRIAIEMFGSRKHNSDYKQV